MFIVNNEILTKQGNPELWDWYQKKINEIKKTEKKSFTFSSFKFHRFEKDENGRKIRMRRYKTVPTNSTFENNDLGETQTWIYVPSANSIRNENGLIRILNPKPFFISESQIYSVDKDIEIIFFLMHISEALKTGKIFLIDTEAENIKKANEAAVAAEAQYLIFSSQSPINEEKLGTDKVYRQLAIAYGITNSSQLHIAELKNKLWNTLLDLNKKRSHSKASYEQFVKDCYNHTDGEFRSSILLAVERGIITYSDNAWWIKIRGEYSELIVRVPQNEEAHKKDILINWLVKNREYLPIINEALDNSVKRIIDINSEIEKDKPGKNDDLKEMKRNELISILAVRGYAFKDLMKFKNKDLIEMIEKNLRPEKVG
jgi:hypothetical protein